MKKILAILIVVALCLVGPAYALYEVSDTGDWPESWPKQLEPLRKQSRTLVGPTLPFRHYAIPFTKRDEMESAWPQILKVKTAGAPVFLVRGPNFFLGKEAKAGIVVHSPTPDPATPEAPINSSNMRARWQNTTYIELVVDGDIVDLNRLPLPADTPIVDERFQDEQDK